MNPLHRELSIPYSLPEDEESGEIARMWIGGGQCHVSLAPGPWTDASRWGILLADLARHVANAYSQQGASSYEDALLRIASGLRAELLEPTDLVAGELTKRDE